MTRAREFHGNSARPGVGDTTCLTRVSSLRLGRGPSLIVSLVAVLLLAVALIGFLVRNGVYVVVGVAGLVLGVAGAWWAITKRAPRRGYGVIGMIVGAVLLVAALLGAGNEDWESFVRALICLVLLATSVLAARAALAASLRTTAASRVHRVRRPLYPVLLCNPWSGGGKVERFALVELATSLGVETVMLDHGLDLGRTGPRRHLAGRRLPGDGGW